MRKLNSILGPLLIVLLLIHGIWGAFQLASIVPGGSLIRKILSYVMVAALAIHVVIGIKLTADTLIAIRRSGASYWKGNELFWISRISGFTLIVLIIYHMFIFITPAGEVFRLNTFGGLQLAGHLLLVAALFIHLAVNIKPLCIALGISGRKFVRDIVIILSIVLLVFAAAFVFYYLRWNVVWRYGG